MMTIEEFLIPPDPDTIPLARVKEAGFQAGNEEVTCQIRLMLTKPFWTVQSLNCRGQPKTSGGDEFYICYHTDGKCVAGNQPMAVASVTDLKNGTYQLSFAESFMNRKSKKPGHLSIHFQYTCGIGYMPPPSKKHWKNGGYTQTVYLQRDLPRPTMTHRMEWTVKVDTSRYSKIFAFGDSVLEQLVTSYETINYGTKVSMPLDNTTLQSIMKLLRESLAKELESRNAVALVLNSALWNVLSDQAASVSHTDIRFEEHLQACRKMIEQIRCEWPHVDVFWVSPTAVHIHRVHVFEELAAKSIHHKIDRVRYMSESRTRQLYQLQKELMRDLEAPFLDIYQASYASADWTLPGDGRHYKPAWNQKVLKHLFAEKN